MTRLLIDSIIVGALALLCAGIAIDADQADRLIAEATRPALDGWGDPAPERP